MTGVIRVLDNPQIRNLDTQHLTFGWCVKGAGTRKQLKKHCNLHATTLQLFLVMLDEEDA